MTQDRLAIASQRMAVATLWLVIAMLALNAAIWIFPQLGSADGGYGLSFSLSNRLILSTHMDPRDFPWWQTLGAILVSSIPLAALALGLLSLRALFRSYARGDYFSTTAAGHMEKMGRAVLAWVILDFLCEPLLSVWITLLQPVGHRLLSLSFQTPDVVAIFLAACIVLIARILRRAADINSENQQFV